MLKIFQCRKHRYHETRTEAVASLYPKYLGDRSLMLTDASLKQPVFTVHFFFFSFLFYCRSKERLWWLWIHAQRENILVLEDDLGIHNPSLTDCKLYFNDIWSAHSIYIVCKWNNVLIYLKFPKDTFYRCLIVQSSSINQNKLNSHFKACLQHLQVVSFSERSVIIYHNKLFMWRLICSKSWICYQPLPTLTILKSTFFCLNRNTYTYLNKQILYTRIRLERWQKVEIVSVSNVSREYRILCNTRSHGAGASFGGFNLNQASWFCLP